MTRPWLALCVALAMDPAVQAAQLAPPNAAGLTFAHVHLSVTDVARQKALWAELLDGEVVEQGGYVAISVPGALIFLTERAPTAPSVGTAIGHVGFKVRDLASTLARWRANGQAVDAEFIGGEGLPQAFVTMPDGTRVELVGDARLSTSAEMHHVHFYAPDHEQHHAWYLERLGGTARARGSFPKTLDVPGVNLTFSSAAAVAPTEGTAIDHVGFEIEDIQAFAKHLKSKGVQFQREPFHVESLDIWVAFFVDPAGARIEISQGLDRFRRPSSPIQDVR